MVTNLVETRNQYHSTALHVIYRFAEQHEEANRYFVHSTRQIRFVVSTLCASNIRILLSVHAALSVASISPIFMLFGSDSVRRCADCVCARVCVCVNMAHGTRSEWNTIFVEIIFVYNNVCRIEKYAGHWKFRL